MDLRPSSSGRPVRQSYEHLGSDETWLRGGEFLSKGKEQGYLGTQ